MRYIPLFAGLLLSSACMAQIPKGLDICPDNQLCAGINQVAKAEQNTAVDILYRYSDASGNGKAQPLDNGSVLHSGDKFTITLQAHKPVYVYLYHFDTNGQLNELLSLSGQSNLLQAGEKRQLPAATKHFRLDEKTGKESIHSIISDKALNDLERLYRQKLLGKMEIAKISKGILIADDEIKSQSQQPLQAMQVNTTPQGRLIRCQMVDHCRESFEIIHQP